MTSDFDKSEVDGTTLFSVGQILNGKYEILSLLGSGGMGSVYKVRHTHLNVELALKTLDSQKVNDATSARRFKTEAKAAFSLKHPNLVKVHDFGVLDNGYPFLAMDLVQGKTLQALLHEKGQLNLEEIEAIFVQLCFGLAYAHQKSIVHRDIKPANIMLVDGMPLNEEGSVKVLDFGIAKIVDEERGTMNALTSTGEVFGSPLYMSPEQCSGGAIDQRTDVYSLGCVLFECLTGTPPLIGNNPLRTMMLHVNEKVPTLREAALGASFPDAIEKVVAKMLAKSPSARYIDLGAAAHEISQACFSNATFDGDATVRRSSIRMKVYRPGTYSVKQTVAASLAVASLSILATLFYVQLTDDKVVAMTAARSPEPRNVKSVTDSIVQGDTMNANIYNLSENERLANSAYKKSGKIAVEYFTENKFKFKRVQFPDYPIGEFHVFYGTRPLDRMAKGVISFPADQPTTLFINCKNNSEIIANAFIFDKVDPYLFNTVNIEFTTKENEMNTMTDLTPQMDAGMTHFLRCMNKWPAMTALSVKDIDLTEERLNAIDGIPNLRNLNLDRAIFDPEAVASKGFISRLGGFASDSGDLTPIVMRLATKPQIVDLRIGVHATVSANAIKSLKNVKKIGWIDVESSTLTPDVFDAASYLKNLTHLSFRRNNTTAAQRASLIKRGWKFDKARSGCADTTDVFFYER